MRNIDTVSAQVAGKQTRIDPPAFFHDLHCRSGFGDRITDLWAVLSIARLHQSESRVDVRWGRRGNRYKGFVANYSPYLFSTEGCRFVRGFPHGSVRASDSGFSDKFVAERCLVPLPCGRRQIILRSGREWGNSCPDRICRDLDHYDIDRANTTSHVFETYQAVASSTRPSQRVVAGIPTDVAKRVGVHIRLQDKLVTDENSFEMSAGTWASIEKQGRKYLEFCIDRGEPLLICSDDTPYKRAIIDALRRKGGDVVATQPPIWHSFRPGYAALVDFFALSRCRRIVQMTKYSTFSIAAAIVGRVPLINFYPREASIGTRLQIWESVLPQVVYGHE